MDWQAAFRHVEEAWTHPDYLRLQSYQKAIEAIIAALDEGQLRAASPNENEEWIVHEPVKKAILLYFRYRQIEKIHDPPFHFQDKIPLKTKFAPGIRVVPPGTARYGSYLAPGVILMPGYVNIGAYVGENTMIDTWATVGSCAQIGRDVHLSGGVGIGGVLEPPQARPVIIEDGAFIGSRAIIVEGVRVGKKAIIGAGVTLTASMPIIDVTGPEPHEYRGYVPPYAVVISGMRQKTFPAGTWGTPCALIIGWRKPEHDDKLALNALLRELDVPV